MNFLSERCKYENKMKDLCVPWFFWVYDSENHRCERFCFRIYAIWYGNVFWDKTSCQISCENNDKKLQRIRWK